MFGRGLARSAGLASLAAVVLSAAAQAQAVAPSSVTPAELKPAASGSAAIALPAAPDLVAPANAANLSVTLGAVSVEGGFEDMAAETRRITDGLAGRRVTVADIYAAASALEDAYGAAGYALARVVVPPQKLDPHGRLRIVVVDGYIQTIDVKGVPERQRGLIAARLAPLVGKRHVKLTEIERRVLLAGDAPGLTLKSTLAAGAATGGARLVVESATERLITGNSGVDNNLPRSLRNWEFTRNLQINSPFGYGEQFYLTATTGYDVFKLFDGTIPLQIFGGGAIVPIGVDGWTINPEYTNAVTRPLPPAGAPKVTGYFQRADLRASYPLIRTRKLTLTLSSTLEWDQEYMTDAFPLDLYRDEYVVWRGKADSQFVLNGGAGLEAAGVLSQGLGGRTGDASVPLSQQGATPTFTKFNVSGQYSQPLPGQFNLALFGSGQTSFGKPLMVSEQFALDGPGAVSGFPTGTFVVDEGAYGRAELGRTYQLTAFNTQFPVEPYVFGAAGFGAIDMPTALQQGTLRVGSAGLGVRTSVNTTGIPFVSGADLAAELARYVSDVPGEREGWRGNLSFSVRF